MIAPLTKKYCIVIALIVTGLFAQSQVIPSDSTLTKVLQSDVMLPVLIDSAIKNSPLVKRTNNSIALSQENIKAVKNSFLSAVSLLSSYNYGTTGDITIGNNSVSSPFSNLPSSKTDRYNVGVSLQLPLTYLISRKSEVRSSEIQVKMAEDEKDNSILYVKQEVIRLYQEFKLSQVLMVTAGKNKQVAYVNFSMTQKDFLHGNENMDQLSRLQDIYSKTTIEYDTYVNRFQTAFLQLQAYTGTQLTKLINQFK